MEGNTGMGKQQEKQQEKHLKSMIRRSHPPQA